MPQTQECSSCGAALLLQLDCDSVFCLYCGVENPLQQDTKVRAKRIAKERRQTDTLSAQAEAARGTLESTTIVRLLKMYWLVLPCAFFVSGQGVWAIWGTTGDLSGTWLQPIPAILFAIVSFFSFGVFVRRHHSTQKAGLDAVRAVVVGSANGPIPACRCCGSALEPVRGLATCQHCQAVSLLDDAAFQAVERAAQGQFDAARRLHAATAVSLHHEVVERLCVLGGAGISWGLAISGTTMVLALWGLVDLGRDFSDSPLLLLLMSLAALVAALFMTWLLDRPYEVRQAKAKA